MNLKISIIIRLDNESDINHIINNITLQTYKNIEIIFGLNEKIDSSTVELKEKNIKIVELGDDFSIENNDIRRLILGYSSGDWIVVLDKADSFLNKKSIQESVELIASDSTIDAFCQIESKDNDDNLSLTIDDIKNNPKLLFKPTLIKRELVAELGLYSENNIFIDILNFDKLIFTSTLITKDIVDYSFEFNLQKNHEQLKDLIYIKYINEFISEYNINLTKEIFKTIYAKRFENIFVNMTGSTYHKHPHLFTLLNTFIIENCENNSLDNILEDFCTTYDIFKDLD